MTLTLSVRGQGKASSKTVRGTSLRHVVDSAVHLVQSRAVRSALRRLGASQRRSAIYAGRRDPHRGGGPLEEERRRQKLGLDTTRPIPEPKPLAWLDLAATREQLQKPRPPLRPGCFRPEPAASGTTQVAQVEPGRFEPPWMPEPQRREPIAQRRRRLREKWQPNWRTAAAARLRARHAAAAVIGVARRWLGRRAAAATTIQRVAARWLATRSGAAAKLAVLLRRRRRKRDVAAKLVQDVWRRRHRLPHHGIRWPIIRPIPRCLWGANLAPQSDFDAQKQLGQEAIDHYAQYVTIFARLAKRPLIVGDAFCAEGNASAGIRAIGAVARGVDIKRYEAYVRRFGADSLTVGDATSEAVLKSVGHVDCWWASPPCQGSSQLPKAGGGLTNSKEPHLIGATRQLLQRLGLPYVIENVMGAASSGEMRRDICLRNHDFGLKAERPRVFEASFQVMKDLDARYLTRRSCLGGTSRMPRLDWLSRKCRPCCWPNPGTHVTSLGIYSTPCHGVTKEMWEQEMGVEPGELTVRGLALSIPPCFSALLVGQMAAEICHQRFGVPVISAVKAKEDPGARALLHRWLIGAGESDPEPGMAREAPTPVTVDGASSDASSECSDEIVAAKRRPLRHAPKGGHTRVTPAPLSAWLTQLFYEDGGEADLCTAARPLSDLRGLIPRITATVPTAPSALAGRHVLCVHDVPTSHRVLELWRRTAAQHAAGTVLTLVTGAPPGSQLRRRLGTLGARLVGTSRDARSELELTAWRLGEPDHRLPATTVLTPEQMLAALDHTDVPSQPDPEAKLRMQYAPYPVDWRAWQRLGYPHHLVERMRVGCQVPGAESIPATDFGRYPEKVPGDDWHVADEMQRCMRRGAMRWAEPDEPVSLIHPWIMVHKGSKVRACQDLSVGLNKLTPDPPPFSLPRVHDLRRWAQPDSYFMKLDLADGFWMVPVAEDSQKLFGVRMPELVVTDRDVAHPAAAGLQVGDRHPDSGRVALSSRIPFGWKNSPAAFCELTNAIAEKMRDEHNIQMLFFVDDAIIVGTREEVERGYRILAAHLAELGVQVAPWKTEGPTRVVDFLGLTVCNLPQQRSISLPRDKQLKLLAKIDQYLEHSRPGDRAEPKELASLLGLLNFAALVVEPGQVFLDRLYAHFKGAIIDWKRGTVRIDGRGTQLILSQEFFSELRWWRENVERRCSIPLLRPDRPADAIVTGTDASDLGCGAVAWLAGSREETQHLFNSFEKAQPINFRELVGATRIIQMWGPRLQGRRLLLETDNMATMWCVRRRKARTALMAEQLRRLYAVAARWDIEVTIVHTPGVHLIRPDAISRGTAPAPPRQRLRKRVFDEVARAWGPFSDGMGAELEHASALGLAPPPTTNSWIHPAFHTVAATLRGLNAELTRAAFSAQHNHTGVVLLPEWEAARWRSLVSSMVRVARWPAGSPILEEWRGRRGWRALHSQTDMGLYYFAAHAGMRLVPADQKPGELSEGDLLALMVKPRDRPTDHRDSSPPDRARMYRVHSVIPGAPVLVQELLYAPQKGASGLLARYRLDGNRIACRPHELDSGLGGCFLVTPWVARAKTGRTFEIDLDALDKLYLAGQAATAADEPSAAAGAPEAAPHDATPTKPHREIGAGTVDVPCLVCGETLLGRQLGRVHYDENESADVHIGCVRPAALARSTPHSAAARTDVSRSKTLMVVPGQVRRDSDRTGRCVVCHAEAEPGSLLVTWINSGGQNGWIHPACRHSAVGQAHCMGGPPAPPGPDSAEPFRSQAHTPTPVEKHLGVWAQSAVGASSLSTTASPGRSPGAPSSSRDLYGARSSTKMASSPDSASTQTGARPATTATGSGGKRPLSRVERERPPNKRRAQISERVHATRLGAIAACMAGECGMTSAREVLCRGCATNLDCQSSAHQACLGFTNGQLAYNNWMCVDCRLSQLGVPASADADTRQSLQEHVLVSMVDDHNTYAPGTDKVALNTRRLIRQCLDAHPALPGPLIDTAQGLKFFGEWLERTDRAGSADLAIRTAASLARHDHPEITTDLCKDPVVKRFLKGLRDRQGDDDTGDTPLPLAMYRHIHSELSKLKRPMLDSRLRAASTMGFQGGTRADEFAGATRGWEAGHHTRIYDSRVEVAYTDRKSSDTLETVTIARRTAASGFDAGQDILDLASQWGMAVKNVKPTSTSEGYSYVDHFVLRLSLNGLTDSDLSSVKAGLQRAPSGYGLGRQGQSAGQRIRDELAKVVDARGDHLRDEPDRFVNVASGTHAEVQQAMRWWNAHGIPQDRMEPLPGPMLLTTVRGSRGTLAVPMPVTTGTLSAELKARMESAYDEVAFHTDDGTRNQLSALPTGLSGRPKWNSHSLRRGGAKLAREILLASGATRSPAEEDINFHFGWYEEAMRGGKKRQTAYASTVPASRRMSVTDRF